MTTFMQSTKRQHPHRRGFTLIEMLVVLAIIVLLATMVAPRFFGTQKKANIDKTNTDIHTIQEALNLYQVHMHRYPSTEQGLAALVGTPGAVEVETFDSEEESSGSAGGNASNWAGPYLNKLQKDPWGNFYQYEYPPTHGSGDKPDIWSFGPDGEDGTEDDIVSWNKSSAQGGDGTGNTESDTTDNTQPDNSTSNTTGNNNGNN